MLYAGRKKTKNKLETNREAAAHVSLRVLLFPPMCFCRQITLFVLFVRAVWTDAGRKTGQRQVFLGVCVWEVNVLLQMKTGRDRTRDPAVLAHTDKCTWTDGRTHAPLCRCPSHFQLSVLPWEVKDMKSTVPALRGQPFSPPFCGPSCPPTPCLFS